MIFLLKSTFSVQAGVINLGFNTKMVIHDLDDWGGTLILGPPLVDVDVCLEFSSLRDAQYIKIFAANNRSHGVQ